MKTKTSKKSAPVSEETVVAETTVTVETTVIPEVNENPETPAEPEPKPELTEDQKNEIVAILISSDLPFSDLVNEAKKIASRKEKEIQIGNVRLNKETRKIISGTEETLLSEKEFGLLTLLFQKKGETISRSEISQEVWKDDSGNKFHSIDVSMNHLRSKLEKSGLPKNSIQTVIGKGYMMPNEA